MRKLAILFLIIFAVSCSKDSPDKPVDTCNQITEVLDYHPYSGPLYQTTVTFTYDEKNRIKIAQGTGLNKAEYTYYDDKIELKATDIFGEDISETYYLDNSHRITGTKSFDYDYRYNEDGYLLQYKQPYGYTNGEIAGFTQYYLKYENGNLVEVYTNENIARKEVILEYYNEPNQDLAGYNSPFYLSLIIYDRNTFFLLKEGYFGKQSKNLLRSLDFHDGYPVNDIQYEYDSKGRILSIPEGYEFKYQCP